MFEVDVEKLTNEEANALWRKLTTVASRAFRGVGYAVLTYVLVSLNTYGLSSAFWLAVAVGLLGIGSASARMGQIAIAVLLAMAIIPLETVALAKDWF